MHAMLNIGVRAARAAGRVITKGYENTSDLRVTSKGVSDFVTEIDSEAEQTIIATIQKSYPDHAFIGEESGKTEGDNTFVWVIDPLDGTTNFIRGIPHFSISIALLYKGKLDQAVVFDPIRGELFTASRGAGAQLNGYRIRVTSPKSLETSVLATALPFRNKDDYPEAIEKFNSLFLASEDVRRMGSAALDLAYVAAGRYDGYFEKGLKSWDIAAGSLIVREAGGLCTDYSGNNDPVYDELSQPGTANGIVAGSPKTVQQMVKVLK
ncbi:MAG: inositol monophosphatase family protein [Pseudomonadota bacterium]